MECINFQNRVDIRYFLQTQEHLVAVCRIGKHFGPQSVWSRHRMSLSSNEMILKMILRGKENHTFNEASSSTGSMQVSVMYLLHRASTTCRKHQ
jgi:hypothetical protein